MSVATLVCSLGLIKRIVFPRNVFCCVSSNFSSKETVTFFISIPSFMLCHWCNSKSNSCQLLGQEKVSAQYLDNLCHLTFLAVHSILLAFVSGRGKAWLFLGWWLEAVIFCIDCGAGELLLLSHKARDRFTFWRDQLPSVNLVWVSAMMPSWIYRQPHPTFTAQSFAYQELHKMKMW